ncbi:MAG: Ig-like domain-containing protein [Candidatus Sericytochromatia bacterium]
MKNKIALVLVPIIFSACSFSGEITTKTTTDKKDVSSSAAPKLKDLPVTKVQINSGTDIVISEGQKGQELSASVTYQDGSIDSNVKWSSSDNTVATVNADNGSISGVKEGNVTIIASSMKDPNQRASIRVSVKRAVVEELKTSIMLGGKKIDNLTLKVDGTAVLQAVVKLSNGSESPNVVWTSSDKTVVSVRNGSLTAVKKGTATITAAADSDSTKQASVVVTVEDESSAPAPTVAPVQATPTPSPAQSANTVK